MTEQARASWHGATNGTESGREALETMTTHRLIVALRGYAAILRDVAEIMEASDERKDVLFVADRLSRSVPELERRVGQTVDDRFVRKSGNAMRYRARQGNI